MIIPEALVEPVNSLQQNMFISAPTVSQTAALRCWDDDCISELESHVVMYRASRALILEELASIREIHPDNIAPADGGFYVYVDLGAEHVTEGYGSTSMCAALLEEKYVAFTPGIDFEATTNLGDRRFRISYSQGVDVAKEGLDRFKQFFPSWLERVHNARSVLSQSAS